MSAKGVMLLASLLALLPDTLGYSPFKLSSRFVMNGGEYTDPSKSTSKLQGSSLSRIVPTLGIAATIFVSGFTAGPMVAHAGLKGSGPAPILPTSATAPSTETSRTSSTSSKPAAKPTPRVTATQVAAPTPKDPALSTSKTTKTAAEPIKYEFYPEKMIASNKASIASSDARKKVVKADIDANLKNQRKQESARVR